MSDFDDVLERLVTDPTFAARLAADPASALAGYTLEADERELLSAQAGGADVADRTVESRTSKAGVVGLLGPALSALGLAASGPGNPVETLGRAGGKGGPLESIGDAPHHVTTSMGSAPTPVETLGHNPDSSHTSMGGAPSVASDYHTRVDADGDGRWDSYVAYNRPDGGVDVEVDMNHDGKVDFIGHDLNRDGIIDSADFDNDFDGTYETHMVDDNGDGWMDRTVPGPGNAPKEAWGGGPK